MLPQSKFLNVHEMLFLDINCNKWLKVQVYSLTHDHLIQISLQLCFDKTPDKQFRCLQLFCCAFRYFDMSCTCRHEETSWERHTCLLGNDYLSILFSCIRYFVKYHFSNLQNLSPNCSLNGKIIHS